MSIFLCDLSVLQGCVHFSRLQDFVCSTRCCVSERPSMALTASKLLGQSGTGAFSSGSQRVSMEGLGVL